MPPTSASADQLQKHHVVSPWYWTDEHPKFLRFSFPSSHTPVPVVPTTEVLRKGDIKGDILGLCSWRFTRRNEAITTLLTNPSGPFTSSENVILRFRRYERYLGCVVFDPILRREEEGKEKGRLHLCAYVDEGYIYYMRKDKAVSLRELTGIKSEQYQPYITALLIAIAQERRSEGAGVGSGRITASVLFSRNNYSSNVSENVIDNIYIYIAQIPLTLIDYLDRPKHVLPTYDTIGVSCFSIPIKPLQSLRQRIVMVLSDKAPNVMKN